MNYELPKTVTETLYISLSELTGNIILSSSDMTEYGYAVLGTTKVTVDVPQVDPREKIIECLEAQATKLKADHHVALTQIKDKIQSLLALEHGVAS